MCEFFSPKRKFEVKRIATFALLLAVSAAGLTPAKAQSPGVAEWARNSRIESKKYAKQQKKAMKKAYKKQRRAAKKIAKAQRKAQRKADRGR